MKNGISNHTRPTPAIEVRELTHQFRQGRPVLNGLSFSIDPGAVYGLAGPNGAGKTTTLRILLGLLRPGAGTARVLGSDFRRADRVTRARVAYVAQEHEVYGGMTAGELSRFLRSLYPRWDHDYLIKLCQRFGLPTDRQLGRLSGGQRREAAIALALAARTEVLIMDEPASSLDPLARRKLLRELGEALAERGETAVLFSTHIMSDLERIAGRVGLLTGGKIALEEDLDALHAQTRRVQVILPDGGSSRDLEIDLPNRLSWKKEGNIESGLVRFPSEDAIEKLVRRTDVRAAVFPVSLEDVVVEVLETQDKETRE